MARQTTFTEDQKMRIRFHLGYRASIAAEWLEHRNNLLLDITESDVIWNVVGDPAVEPRLTYQGEPLCHEDSVLGRCELAWSKLSPATIDDSLFVSAAGLVALRGNEVILRRQLYRVMVEELSAALDIEPFESAGYVGY